MNKAFLKFTDAKKYAEELAKEIGGYALKNSRGVNVRAFPEAPEELESWSGEVACFDIYDHLNEHYAVVGWWSND